MLVGPQTIAAIAKQSGLSEKAVSREFEAYCLRIRGGILGRNLRKLDTNLVDVHGFITRSNKTAEWHPDDECTGSVTARVNCAVRRAAEGLCPDFAGASKEERRAFQREHVYTQQARDIFDDGLRDTIEYEHPELKMDDPNLTVRTVLNKVQRAASHCRTQQRGFASRHAGDLEIVRIGRCPELVAVLQLAQLSSSHTARARS